MDLRIGVTPEGRAAWFDTCSTRPLLLVGDTGRGKTTLTRFLARWWLADTTRHVHVFSNSPAEWADHHERTSSVGQPTRHLGGTCTTATCLVVLDDLTWADECLSNLLPLHDGPVIVTAREPAQLPGKLHTDATCLGLVRSTPTDATEAAVLNGQARLDWPPGTLVVIPDRRGPVDFPCHRWHTPVETPDPHQPSNRANDPGNGRHSTRAEVDHVADRGTGRFGSHVDGRATARASARATAPAGAWADDRTTSTVEVRVGVAQ